MKKFLALACVALLSACSSGQHGGLRQELSRLTRNLRGHVAPLPKVTTYKPVAYKDNNKIDPFNPQRIDLMHAKQAKAVNGTLKPNLNRPRGPLEHFPLGSIKMVGTVTMGGQTYGLVEADSALYRVRKGNYMGEHFGVITGISATHGDITLRELIQDNNGEWVQRTSKLHLAEANQ